MKKFTKKLTLAIVLVLACVLALTLMVACNSEENKDDTPQTPAHTHSYAWKSDANNHWKECATDGAVEDGSLALHVDAAGDGTCDVCGYNGMHVHNYTTWDKDAEGHWQVCACGALSAKAPHADSADDTDELCDDCGYDMHVHNYTLYDKNAEGHWLVCACGAAKANSTEDHFDSEDADELCDDCGYNMHVHNYTVDNKDASYHWKECACGAVDASTKVKHVDTTPDDEVCDVCGQELKYIVTVKDPEGNALSGLTVKIGGQRGTTDENGKVVVTGPLTIDEDSIIEIEGYDTDNSLYVTVNPTEDTYEYNIQLIDEVSNTFTFKTNKDAVIAGLSVKLMDGETVLASGTTNAEGKVEFTYKVGPAGQRYNIAIENLSESYSYSQQGVNKNDNGKNIPITVYEKTTYTVTVACDEGVNHSVSGLTVEMYESKRGTETLIASATTDAEGVATLKAVSKGSGYIVRISGLQSGLTAEDGTVDKLDLNTMTVSTTATLTIKNASSEPASTVLAIGDNTVNASFDGIAYTFTATVAGQYKISSTDENYYMGYDDEWFNSEKTFTMAAGETITVLFSTDDSNATYSYVVTVESVGSSGGDEGGTTPGGDEGGSDVFAFPTELVGTWYLSDGTPITITADSLVKGTEMLGQTAQSYAIVTNAGVTTYTFTIGRANCSIYKQGDDWYYSETGQDAEKLLDTDPFESEGGGSGSVTPSGTALTIGTNTVNATMNGTEYYFTATEAGQYKISSTDANFGLMDPLDVFESVWGAGDKTFTLSAGQTVNVLFSMNDMSATGTYEVVVEKVGEGSGSGSVTPSGTALTIGTNTVNATMNGAEYYFTATEAGQYKISSTDANFGLMDPLDVFESVWGAGDKTFTLSAGQTVNVLFSLNDMSATGTYEVVVAYLGAANEGGDSPAGGEGDGTPSEGGDDTPTVPTSVPTEMIGTWDSDFYGLVISSDSLVLDGEYTFTLTDGNLTIISATQIKIVNEGEEMYFTYDSEDDSLLTVVEDEMVTFTKVTSTGGDTPVDGGDTPAGGGRIA